LSILTATASDPLIVTLVLLLITDECSAGQHYSDVLMHASLPRGVSMRSGQVDFMARTICVSAPCITSVHHDWKVLSVQCFDPFDNARIC